MCAKYAKNLVLTIASIAHTEILALDAQIMTKTQTTAKAKGDVEMPDCFSLPNAAELVEKLRNYSAIADDIRYAVLMKRAADAIEALLVENAKMKAERDAAVQWISVKERLPKEDGQYLVYVKEADEEHGCVLNAWFNPFELTIVPLEIGWTLLYEFYEFSDRLRGCITHWMPLPEPPKEEE